MKTDKLISLIEKEIEILNKKIFTPNKELEFFDKVITENSFTSIKGLIKMNCLDVMVAYLCINSKKYDHTEIEKRLLLNKELIDDYHDEFVNFFYMYLEKKRAGKRISMEEKFIQFGLSITNLIDYKSLEELYKNNDSELFDIMALIKVVKEMKEDYEINSQILESEVTEARIRITEKKKNSFLEREIKNDYRIDNMIKKLSQITTYYHEIKAKDKSKKKELRKQQANYNEVKKILLANKDFNFDKVLTLIENEKIKKEFLYQYNISKKEEFDKLSTEYNQLSLDNKLDIQALFNDYGIDFNNFSSTFKSSILSYDKELLKIYLDKIKLLNINDSDMIEFIMINVDYRFLDTINNMIKNGLINIEFIINNREFLIIDNSIKNNYIKLMDLLELWEIKGVNPRIFITDLDVYLTDLNTLKNNFDILKQYNLFQNLKTITSFDLLKKNDLATKIDILLELGYEKILEQDLELLNKDISKIKKLYILKSMDLLPPDKESLLKVLDDDKFLNLEKELDAYIFNIVDYQVDNSLLNKVKELTSLYRGNIESSSTRVVQIGDVIFSKNRIKRNMKIIENLDLSEEEKVFNSILIGSVLSEEEYDTITEELKGKNLQITL